MAAVLSVLAASVDGVVVAEAGIVPMTVSDDDVVLAVLAFVVVDAEAVCVGDACADEVVLCVAPGF